MIGIRCLLTLVLLTLLAVVQSSAPQNVAPTDKQFIVPSGKTSAQLAALDALNAGTEELKNGQYEKAIDDFKDAKRFDPDLLNARLYLATAYASEYIPGGPSDENRENGELAVAEFRNVLALDAGNLTAMDALGSLELQMAGSPFNRDLFLESKSYFQNHIKLKPNDPEPYFWIGVIDWTLAFRSNSELRKNLTEAEADPLPPYLRVQYSTDCGTTIQEGIDSLNKAISLRPDYDDAMAYLNLLYRRKADVVDNQVDRDELIDMADDLVEKVKEIKTARADKPAQPQAEPQAESKE
jgi:tetratricopeptide (TPR) repeat protein